MAKTPWSSLLHPDASMCPTATRHLPHTAPPRAERRGNSRSDVGESRTGHAAGSQDNLAGSFPLATEDWGLLFKRVALDLAVSGYCALFLADPQAAPAQHLGTQSLDGSEKATERSARDKEE